MPKRTSPSPSAARAAEIDVDFHAAVARRLRAVRQRYSTGRRAIAVVLAAADRPLTAPEVVELGSGLSVSSVYRNLAVLEQAGVVRRLVTQEENARYELAEAFTHHHHHLVCERCGIIMDYEPPAGLERALQRALDAIPQSTFQPRSHHIQILGLCPGCTRATTS